ncbi:hypothetical protein [Exiguobacterium sp. s127]|uniref:hypothetical protein n=1 Tax=Exiguobacterium sp. s127 TaxID=2751210 RepID=UPI001BE6EE89|nr:hypothetical protein [Exiguobacterium sp. s127]
MKPLINDLKEHLNWKMETRKYTDMGAVYGKVVSIFKELKDGMSDYSIGGDPLVNYIEDDYRKSTTLKVDTSLFGDHYVRHLKVEPDISKSHTFLIECSYQDLDPAPPPQRIAEIKVGTHESTIKILKSSVSVGIDRQKEVVFTQEEFEDLIREALLYKVEA